MIDLKLAVDSVEFDDFKKGLLCPVCGQKSFCSDDTKVFGFDHDVPTSVKSGERYHFVLFCPHFVEFRAMIEKAMTKTNWLSPGQCSFLANCACPVCNSASGSSVQSDPEGFSLQCLHCGCWKLNRESSVWKPLIIMCGECGKIGQTYHFPAGCPRPKIDSCLCPGGSTRLEDTLPYGENMRLTRTGKFLCTKCGAVSSDYTVGFRQPMRIAGCVCDAPSTSDTPSTPRS